MNPLKVEKKQKNESFSNGYINIEEDNHCQIEEVISDIEKDLKKEKKTKTNAQIIEEKPKAKNRNGSENDIPKDRRCFSLSKIKNFLKMHKVSIIISLTAIILLAILSILLVHFLKKKRER